ncbi:MAG TPA: type II toxin-antitoxin system HicB family antitoxin [Methylomirabilota bacterium]|nr:type II toxin-antitoxin system HicB family antitoxin [Methylomirabilota bacterium]
MIVIDHYAQRAPIWWKRTARKEKRWFVSLCPELGVASQGKTQKEAYSMLADAVEGWLEIASTTEIKRRLKTGATVQPLDLAHA